MTATADDSSSTNSLLATITDALLDKHGIDIKAMHVTELTSVADYFVFATGQTRRHTETLSDAVVDAVKAAGDEVLGVEGRESAQWILVDTGDIIVHLFLADAREHYAIEKLWMDAPTTTFDPTTEPPNNTASV